MTPMTINNSCSNNSILKPIVALVYVFSKQECSIQALEFQNDPTVRLLYSIAQQSTEDPVSKIARKYANAGFVYIGSCLQKYTQEPINTAEAMPEPRSLPEGVIGSTGRTTVTILPSLPLPEKKTDMEFVEEFVTEWRKDHMQISWKECYKQGVNKGFFKSYSDSASLKSTYYELKRLKNKRN
ncbi:hypothetical protein BDC45DRAFT_532716 [Circinella umbellata]|nr:hypothetical protein BDC45DRAFT_532716 [Circinella umbellata]